MRADYLSFARATSLSLLGLVIQLILGLAFFLYGIFGQDPAATTAAIFMFAGIPVWLTLAVLYDLHRRERIEDIEAESFAASDAATSSVFEQQDDLRVAAKRLRSMYRFLVPTVSLGVGALLVGLGIWRFNTVREIADTLEPRAHGGWGVAIGLGVAFVGFLFARYISGMAKEKVWANLRGGAGYAVGSALLGLVLALTHFVLKMGATPVILKYVTLGIPIVLVVLGGEIFLNFVFELYRPRKPGEMPRPAFESWILGLVAAPDRIAQRVGEALNYQFGYDVSGSWFYRLISRTFVRILLPVAIVVAWGLTALTVIRPHETGMVLRFGQFSRVIGPGLHVKYPWPIETVDIPEFTRLDARGRVEFRSRTVTGVRTIDVGTPPPATDKLILWTNTAEHATEEVFFLVQPERTIPLGRLLQGLNTPGEGPQSQDLAMLAAEIPLHYSVDDVEAFDRLAPPSMRDDLLRSVAQRAVMEFLSTRTVGDLLGGRRAEVQEELRKRVEEAFVRINPKDDGKPVVKVLFVGLQGVHPPGDAVITFEQVITAEQKYHARLKEAEGTAIETLTMAVGSVELANQIVRELDKLESLPTMVNGEPNPQVTEQQLVIRELIEQAGGRAAAIILQSSAERWERHMNARARLAAYQGQLATYKAAPALYRAGLYLDALKSVMADARVIIADPDATLRARTDLQDRESVTDIFQKSDE